MSDEEQEKKPRGFGLLKPHDLKRLAQKGSKVAQATGRTHKFSSEEASAAGKKGAESRAAKKQALLDLPEETK